MKSKFSPAVRERGLRVVLELHWTSKRPEFELEQFFRNER